MEIGVCYFNLSHDKVKAEKTAGRENKKPSRWNLSSEIQRFSRKCCDQTDYFTTSTSIKMDSSWLPDKFLETLDALSNAMKRKLRITFPRPADK